MPRYDFRHHPRNHQGDSMEQAQRTCPNCGPVLATRPAFKHSLHILLCLFCWVWPPVYLILFVIHVGRQFNCSQCGLPL
jgi:hypothetical protein